VRRAKQFVPNKEDVKMSKQKRRDVWWVGLRVFASAWVGLCTYGYATGFFG